MEDIAGSFLHSREVTNGLAVRLVRLKVAGLSVAGDSRGIGGGFGEGFGCAAELATGLAWVPASCLALLFRLSESLGLVDFVSSHYSFEFEGVERKRRYVPCHMVVLGASSLEWPQHHA